jgi:glyoxylase-like metal-dependent hydrolase (beta-lactamase superfamily II)
MGMEVRRERLAVPSGVIDLITLFSVQPFENNVYVLVDPGTNESLVIDASEARPIVEATEGRVVNAVLITHGHRDHQAELPGLKEVLPTPVGVCSADAKMLLVPPDFTIADGQEFTFGRHRLRAIATPGHTPGGTCFLIGSYLFSGDTLFPGGPGNTSNPLGDFPTIIESIRSRLFTLPDQTVLLPGHGRSTTIGAERSHLDEWIARGW